MIATFVAFYRKRSAQCGRTCAAARPTSRISRNGRRNGRHGKRQRGAGHRTVPRLGAQILPERNPAARRALAQGRRRRPRRSEEHTSELQSLMRISYAVFCLKKKKQQKNTSEI